MKAEERTIGTILNDQVRYVIPPYQRPYSWEKENVQQLIEDVWDAFQSNDTEYFIGSLITIQRAPDDAFEVVDGQQRLTTLNLILARIREYVQDSAVKAELEKRILPRNVFTGEAETPRLLLRESDRTFFRKHILEGKAIDPNSRDSLDSPQRHLAENLETVDAFCKDKNETTLKLFANYLLFKVWVVFVGTNSWTSAHRLFNVLNARGLPLSNADLIKGALFRNVDADSPQSAAIAERWEELEELLGIESLDGFFGHFRTARAAAKARGAVHEEIGLLLQKSGQTPIDFIDDVIESAIQYARISSEAFSDPKALRSLRALRRVEYDDWIPALMAYLKNPTLGMDESEFIVLLERITMQNWIRRLGRTARMTAYYQLINAIREKKDVSAVRSIFRASADNSEFMELLQGDIYGKPFDFAVLIRLEEATQDLSVTKSYDGRTTIEHVLPQSLKDKYWQDRFDDQTHKKYLHRLGNLALLSGSKNYKAQYFDFDRKKKIYDDRDKKVSFDLTKEITRVAEWNADAIEAHRRRLLDLAREIWTIL